MSSFYFLYLLACAEPSKSAGFFDTEDSKGKDPESENCHVDIEGWPSSSYQMEMEVIERVNEMRSIEQDCRTEGIFSPTPPLKYEPHLQCSSRYHARWMAENEELNHDSFGGDLGDDFYQRVESTNYVGYAIGENIAAGYDTSRSVVRGWMDSDGHCSIIMSPDAKDIGVGYFMDENTLYLHWWTLNVGTIF
jgi:uncharacterized protein YkwD